MNIGILNPGKMGVVIAQSMANSGQTVHWISAGRSDATRQRAEAADLTELTSGAEMVETCEAIVSVCPPHAAIDVAEMVIDAGFSGLYVDANAIAPRTSKQIGGLLEAAGIEFVDGGIIGHPPTERNQSWLYLSGPKAELVAKWFEAGPHEAQVINDQIGAASAMKMCYAANTKGTNALVTAIMGAAYEMGVLDHLVEMWDRHFPGFAEQRQKASVSVAYNKAWRFAGEMEEMAKTWEDAGVPNGFFEAAAEVYHRIGHLRESDGEQTLETVLKEVKTGNR